MSESNSTGRAPQVPSERELAALLEKARAPEPLPEDDLRQIREAVRQEWRVLHGRADSSAEGSAQDSANGSVDAAPPEQVAPGRFDSGVARGPDGRRSEPDQLDRQSRERFSDGLGARGVSWARPGLLAAAAAVLVGLGTWWMLRPSVVVSTVVVGEVERVVGEVVSGASSSQTSFQTVVAGDDVSTGRRFETRGDSSRLGFRLTSGTSVRLDAETAVEWHQADSVELLRGAIYVDSDDPLAPPLEIATTFGTVREIGTQFVVRVDETRLVVGVRDGRVEISPAGETHDGGVRREIGSGERLVLGSGEIVVESMSSTDEDWVWVESVAPSFDPAGRSVADFLDWYERQTGEQIRYADSGLGEKVAATPSGGGLADLGPRSALDGVLKSAGLTSDLVDGVRTISAAPSE